MKVALVHDWLTGMRGGERCLQAFVSMYPQSDIFTLIHRPGTTTQQIDERVVKASFLNSFPGVGNYYRVLLPLFPAAASSFELSGYDLVISLSHAAAKNVRLPHGVPHVCYCFTPMRYIWDQASNYFGSLAPVLEPGLELLRRWDKRGAQRVTKFVAISRFVAARIRCYYGRQAHVVYPPVDTAWLMSSKSAGELTSELSKRAFLYAGALVPYKRPDLVIEAFNRMSLPLWVVGTGPLLDRLKAKAKPNIRFFGHVSDQELAQFYRYCRALIFPAVEDFGLVPVECNASGRPVIGLFDGGLRETLAGLRAWDDLYNSRLEGSEATGVFFRGQGNDLLPALIDAVHFFLRSEGLITREACERQAAKFSLGRFVREWSNSVSDLAGIYPQLRYSDCTGAEGAGVKGAGAEGTALPGFDKVNVKTETAAI